MKKGLEWDEEETTIRGSQTLEWNEEPSPQAVKPKKKAKKTWIIAGAITVVAILVLASFLIVFAGNDNGGKEEETDGDDDEPGKDTDGDGVLDSSDAFPNDPAASKDTDGDGYPDEWNPGKSAEDSTSSPPLQLDSFPFDPNPWPDDDDDDDDDDPEPIEVTGVLIQDKSGSNYAKDTLSAGEGIIVVKDNSPSRADSYTIKKVKNTGDYENTVYGGFELEDAGDGYWTIKNYIEQNTTTITVQKYLSDPEKYKGNNIEITGINSISCVYSNHTFGFNTNLDDPLVFLSLDKTPTFLTDVTLSGSILPENFLKSGEWKKFFDIDIWEDLNKTTEMAEELSTGDFSDAGRKILGDSGLGNHILLINEVEYDSTTKVEGDCMDLITPEEIAELGLSMMGESISTDASKFIMSFIKRINENLVVIAEKDNTVETADYWFILSTDDLAKEEMTGKVTIDVAETNITKFTGDFGMSADVPSDKIKMKIHIGVTKIKEPVVDPYKVRKVRELWGELDETNGITAENSVEMDAFANILSYDDFVTYLEKISDGEGSDTIKLLKDIGDFRNPAFALLIDEKFTDVFNDDSDFHNYTAWALIPDLEWDNKEALHFVHIKGVVYDCKEFFNVPFNSGNYPLVIADNFTKEDIGELNTLQYYWENQNTLLSEEVTHIVTEGYLAGTTTNRVISWTGDVANEVGLTTIGEALKQMVKYSPADLCFYRASNFTYSDDNGAKITGYNVPVVYLKPFVDKGPFFSGHPLDIKGFYVNNKEASNYIKNKFNEWTDHDDNLENIREKINDDEEKFHQYLDELLTENEDEYNNNFDGWIFAYSIKPKEMEFEGELNELYDEVETTYNNQLITHIKTEGYPIGTAVKYEVNEVDEDKSKLFPFDVGLYLLNDVDTVNSKSYHIPVILIDEYMGKRQLPPDYVSVEGLYIKGEYLRNATVDFVKNLLGDTDLGDPIYLAVLDTLLTLKNEQVNVFDGVIWGLEMLDATAPTYDLAAELANVGFVVGENLPPNIPGTPTPPDDPLFATPVQTSTNLTWQGGDDPDPGDTVTYDIYLDTTDASTRVSNNQSGKMYAPPSLEENTEYYWKVVAWDNQGAHTEGPVWHFKTVIGNNPPNAPNTPTPVNNSENQLTSTTLSWSCSDPDPGDTLVYDVYLDTNPNPTTKVASDSSSTTYEPGGLSTNQDYYWKIVAKDGKGGVTVGPIWSFQTGMVRGANSPEVDSNVQSENELNILYLSADEKCNSSENICIIPEPSSMVLPEYNAEIKADTTEKRQSIS